MLDPAQHKPVKLTFPDDKGEYHEEFIPTISAIESWLNDKRFMRLIKKRGDFYYWNFYHFITPIERKVLDINFLQHITNDHGTKENLPNAKEIKHFAKIYPSYEWELMYLDIEDYKKYKKEKFSKDVRLQKDPYIKAYKKRWINTFNYGPNFKLFYHGAGAEDAIEFLANGGWAVVLYMVIFIALLVAL